MYITLKKIEWIKKWTTVKETPYEYIVHVVPTQMSFFNISHSIDPTCTRIKQCSFDDLIVICILLVERQCLLAWCTFAKLLFSAYSSLTIM